MYYLIGNGDHQDLIVIQNITRNKNKEAVLYKLALP